MSEGDRARSGPWAEVRVCVLEVGVGCEPESPRVVGGAEDEVAYEFDRRGDGWRLLSAEAAVGEPAELPVVGGVWSHRVLDAKAPDVEQVDAGAAAVATPAGDQCGDQPAGALVGVWVVPFGCPSILRPVLQPALSRQSIWSVSGLMAARSAASLRTASETTAVLMPRLRAIWLGDSPRLRSSRMRWMVCSSLIGGLIADGADGPGPLRLERWDACWAGSRLCAGNLARVTPAADLSPRPADPELEGLLSERDALIAQQAVRITELEALVQELRARRDQNSRNSSKPPSSDGYAKEPANKKRSLRRKSHRKRGGQRGHQGHHLERREDPDRAVLHPVEGMRVLRAGPVGRADR